MGEILQLDYYYGIEAEQFSFYRVPRLLIKDERFKKLSSDAKLLYGLMLDRMSLSMKNEWFDDENRAYIIYTIDSIMEDLGCASLLCLEEMNMCDENMNLEEQVTEPVESKVETEPLFEEMVDFDTFSKSDFRVVKVKECSAVKKSKKLLHFVLDDGTGTDRIILSGIHAYYEPEELVGKTLLAITNLPPRSMMGIDSCGMLLSAVHTVNGEEKLNLVMLDDAIPAGAKLY